MDFEIQRSTRHCSATGRELKEGEAFYSVLVREGREIQRLDFSAEAWQGAPDHALASWKSVVPARNARKAEMAPNDVLWEYFQDLEARGEEPDTLYVLALLLIRRRVLRLEGRESQKDGSQCIVLYCPRDETQHRLADKVPNEERINEIEKELAQRLYATSH